MGLGIADGTAPTGAVPYAARLGAGRARRGGRAGDDAIPGVAEDVELVVGEVLQEERAHAGEVRGAGGGEHLGAGRA